MLSVKHEPCPIVRQSALKSVGWSIHASPLDREITVIFGLSTKDVDDALASEDIAHAIAELPRKRLFLFRHFLAHLIVESRFYVLDGAKDVTAIVAGHNSVKGRVRTGREIVVAALLAARDDGENYVCH